MGRGIGDVGSGLGFAPGGGVSRREWVAGWAGQMAWWPAGPKPSEGGGSFYFLLFLFFFLLFIFIFLFCFIFLI